MNNSAADGKTRSLRRAPPAAEAPAPAAPETKRRKKRAPRELAIVLRASTIWRVLLTALLVVIAIQLWTPFLIFIVAVLLALTLEPIAQWFERRGASRGMSVAIVSTLLIAMCAALVIWVVPPLVEQVSALANNYGALRARVESEFPKDWPVLRQIVQQVLALFDSPEFAERFAGPLIWGELAVEAFSGVIVVLAMTIYLLVDGKRMFAWLVSYVPRRHRPRILETMPPVTEVVRGYVRAQVVTSLLCGGSVYVAMELLGVPAALPLAVLSAVLNVIPVIGSIVMLVPAVILALTVSPTTALLVLAFHAAYNVLETNVLIPWIFGKSLRMSTLAVLLALLVGGILQGFLGMFLILPLVAAYPIIERIWLGRYLGHETVRDHKELVATAGHGAKSEHAVDTVLRGEEHPREIAHAEAAGREPPSPGRPSPA